MSQDMARLCPAFVMALSCLSADCPKAAGCHLWRMVMGLIMCPGNSLSPPKCKSHPGRQEGLLSCVLQECAFPVSPFVSSQAQEEARRNRLMRDMAQLRLQVGTGQVSLFLGGFCWTFLVMVLTLLGAPESLSAPNQTGLTVLLFCIACMSLFLFFPYTFTSVHFSFMVPHSSKKSHVRAILLLAPGSSYHPV